MDKIKYIDIIDNKDRRQLINMDEVQRIVEHGSYRRLIFKDNSHVRVYLSYDELKFILKERYGHIQVFGLTDEKPENI